MMITATKIAFMRLLMHRKMLNMVKLKNSLVIFILVLSFTYASHSIYAQKGKNGNKSIGVTNTIVNEYTALTQDANAGATTIYVTNSGLNSNSRFPAILAAGDLLMIIQMKGATTTSYESGGFGYPLDATWGAISSYGSCGFHEFVQVKNVPNLSSIEIDCGLKHSYTTAGKTQVIRVPRYLTLLINAGGVLTCESWNGATGGVVSVEVQGNTIMHSGGSIWVTGKGFRGGQLDNDFFWGGYAWAALNSIEGAEKGEGILGYQSEYNSIGGRYCRGAAANAGGGGNTHNSGGGGGANGGNPALWSGKGNPDISNGTWVNIWNLEEPNFANHTSSGGGRGGYSFSNSNQNAATAAPGNSSWGGDQRRNIGGYGGRPLDYSTGRIFLGGGGGAGEQNDSYGGAGGNGGGIVYFLSYGDLTGDGQIVANGDNGINSSSPWGILGYDSDGAGGGGGGGAVIINTFGTVTGITIRANGGNGGNQNIQSTNKVQAQGPGGGGGGGHIAVANGTPPREALSGLNGTTNSSSLTEFIPNGATKGGAGVHNAAVTNFQIIAPNDTICSGHTATLNASLTGTVPPNTTITWYDDIIAGNVLGAGNTFTTPILTQTTTYYVGTCPGHYRNPVTVVVINSAFTAGSNASICNGGTTTLNASGGNFYQWSPPSGLSNTGISNPVASPTVTTTYTVTITNYLGCSGTSSIVVTVGSLTANAGNDTILCTGQTLQLNATGGTNYQWAANTTLSTTNINNPVASPVVTTTYLLTVTDNAGCVGTDNIVVTVAPLPVISAGNNQNICQGGSVQLNATGGNTYVWSPIIYLSDPNISNPTAIPLQTTTYTVTGTDANACSNTASVVVTITNANANASNDTTICKGSSVQLFASGGVSYSWSPGATLNDSTIAQPIAYNTVTTTYYLQLADSIGCISHDTVTVNVVESVNASFTYSGHCAGDITSFTSTSTDSLGTIVQWQWNFGDGATDNIANPDHLYTNGITYPVTLVVTNNAGCYDSITQNVVIYDKPIVSFTPSLTHACAPITINFTNNCVNAVTHLWLFGNGTSSTQHNPSITYNTPGTYNVILTSTSPENCSSYQQQLIHVYQPPVAAFTATPAVTITGTTVGFSNQSSNATSYYWNFADGFYATDFNTSHMYQQEGTFNVWLYVMNNHNCVDSVSHEIVVEQAVTFFMPSAFTPNQDNNNDLFGPKGLGLNNDDYELYIYDRWGKLHFYTNDANNMWDGTSMMTGKMLPKGLYTWVVLFSNHGGTKHLYRFTGTVVLL